MSRGAPVSGRAAARAAAESESYWRGVSTAAIGTSVESGSWSTRRRLVSSRTVGSSACVKSSRTLMESAAVATRGLGPAVSCTKLNSVTRAVESSVTSVES